MIKKHLITCSVILVLFIVSQLFICSTTIKRKAVSVTSVIDTKAVNNLPLFIRYNKDANDEVNFADESVPANNLRVSRKLNQSIRANSYRNIGSNLLHKKAVKLFPVIEPILELYGIPNDFKYIPLVESGLKSGTSIRGARGLWQFMPGTARTYGLKVNKHRDERMDVKKATVAACIYLRELYAEYNNWTLTAAAYNLGTIKLNRAIRENKKRNYYYMHLNAETGSYVYKLLAMKAIINKPDTYGYHNNYQWLNPSELLAAN